MVPIHPGQGCAHYLPQLQGSSRYSRDSFPEVIRGSLRFLSHKIKLIGFIFLGPGKVEQVFSEW